MNQGTKSDCFALGFDLETYAAADKDRIFAGMNTLNSDISFGISTLLPMLVVQMLNLIIMLFMIMCWYLKMEFVIQKNKQKIIFR